MVERDDRRDIDAVSLLLGGGAVERDDRRDCRILSLVLIREGAVECIWCSIGGCGTFDVLLGREVVERACCCDRGVALAGMLLFISGDVSEVTEYLKNGFFGNTNAVRCSRGLN